MKTLRYIFLLGIGVSLFVMGSLLIFAQDESDNSMMMDDPALVEHGHELFVANGCIACHGQNAEGTDIAPALGGHNEFQIRRQVRSPASIMLVFSPTQIPADDLSAIVAYILSLEPADMEDMHHDMSGVQDGDIIFAHHWRLWLELEDGDINGAIHHTAHILELVEGPHLAAMQPVMAALQDGDLDTAKAIVEPMVTDIADFTHDGFKFSMQFIYYAAAAGNLEVAEHFATDLTEHDLTDEQMATATDVLEHIQSCDFAGAEMLIETALDGDVNFIPESMSMNPHMEMDMGSDEHTDENMDMATEQASDGSMDMGSDDHTDESMDMGSGCGTDEGMDMGDETSHSD